MTRHARILLLAALAGLLPLAAPLAEDAQPVSVRIGSHDGYGRIVFNLPGPTEYRVTRQGQRVTISFAGDTTIDAAPGVPHNVLGITGGAGRAELVVASGTTVRDWRLGDRLVVDVLDGSAATDAPAPAREAATGPTPAAPTAAGVPSSGGPSTPAGAPASAAAPSRSVSLPSRAAPLPATPPPAAKSAPASAAPSAATQARATNPPSHAASPPASAAASPSASPTAPPSDVLAAVRQKPSAASPLAAKPSRATPAPGATPAAGASRPAVAAAGTLPPAADATATQADAPPHVESQAAKPEPSPPPPKPASAGAPPAEAPSAPSSSTLASPPDPVAIPTGQPAASATPTASPEQATAGLESGLVVPGSPQLGVAVFRRGNVALIVFDQRRPVDTAPLADDPVFGSATVQLLPAATVLRVVLDPAMALAPSRTANGWRIATTTSEPTLRPIQATASGDRLTLPVTAPGAVVTLTDPDTGATLLVGTQRRDGQGVLVQRRSPEFILLPTWLGVAVAPNADTLELRPTPQGFILAGNLALSPAADASELLAHAGGLTRQFDFPDQSTDVRLQRLRSLVDDDAATPPLARGPTRQAVARTMIALGLGSEAGAMLRMAAADDPLEAASADNAGLTAIAALLAHRPDAADGLADPRLQAADDVALWRAVRLAQLQDGSGTAAAMFAATLPLVLAYPPEIRDRLLPLVAETLVAGGETATASALLEARPTDPALDLARAMLLEAKGDSAAALAAYDALARSRDQSVHVRASARAVELRLATGAYDAGQAAERLESLVYAWRGDRQERALRERLAALKARAGNWRFALAMLRDTETLFPDDKTAIHARLTDMFATLLRDDATAKLAPLDLVSVLDENTDLLPTGADGDALQARLADRLVSLDLPRRAAPVLEKLMLAAPSGVARAGFGARLAALRLGEDDSAGALAALDASVAADLPADLVERRTLLVANANARRGDTERAMTALATLDSPAADEARATILERANDWPAAQRALTGYVAKTVPAEGRLDDGQRRALLRLATAAARAGDDAELTTLRQREDTRMESWPLADMFRLLTAGQVRVVGDLKRSGQEAALARALPAQLKALPPPQRPNE